MQILSSVFTLCIIVLMISSVMANGEGLTNASLNNIFNQEALQSLLIKVTTTPPSNLRSITTNNKEQPIFQLPSQFQVDFILEGRGPSTSEGATPSSFNKNPYRGRAIVKSVDGGKKTFVKLHAISRHHNQGHKKRSIYFDSDMFSYTQEEHHHEGNSTKRTVPTAPVAFHSLFEALRDAYFISEEVPIFDSASSRLCPPKTMNRLAVFFEHQHYMLCFEKTGASQPAIVAQIESLKYIIGQEFIVEIVNVKTEPNTKVRGGTLAMAINTGSSGLPITEERLLDEKAEQNFPKVPQPFEKTATDKALLQVNNKPTEAFFLNSHSLVCKLSWLRGSKCQENRILEAKKKICFFLHGAGQWPEDKGEPVNNFSPYWGPVAEYTPQCSERWFIREETKYRGWDNPDLQRSYCDLLLLNHLPNRKANGTMVKDAVIFAHSMGNLILAAAIKNGVCSIDQKSVSWYDIQGPIRGTHAIERLQEICSQKTSFTNPSFTKFIAQKGGYCIGPDNPKPYPTYETLHPHYKGISDLEPIARKYIKGQMCGISSFGLNTYYSPALQLFSMLIDYKESNDGLVPFSSCVIDDNSKFSENYKDGFYKVAANHADGTCMNGDAWFGSAKPCSFYSGKI